MSAKMEFVLAKCIFPNIQLKDVVNRYCNMTIQIGS